MQGIVAGNCELLRESVTTCITSNPYTLHHPIQLRSAFVAIEAAFKAVTDIEKAEVVGLGGLHVVGTERHESRRIDNQLRGRSGRQGDPGSTRYGATCNSLFFLQM